MDIIIPDDKQAFVGGLVVGQQRPVGGPEQELLLQQKLYELPFRDLHLLSGSAYIGAVIGIDEGIEVISFWFGQSQFCSQSGRAFLLSQ